MSTQFNRSSLTPERMSSHTIDTPSYFLPKTSVQAFKCTAEATAVKTSLDVSKMVQPIFVFSVRPIGVQ